DNILNKGRRVQFLLVAYRVIYPLFYIAGERDFDSLIHSIYIDLPYFSITPDHDLFVIRCPCITGIQSEYRPGFLLIFAELIIDGPFITGFQVAQMQNRFSPYSFYKRQRFSIMRYLRPNGTTSTTRHVFNCSFIAVKPSDHKDLVIGVFIILKGTARVHVFAEIDITAIG